jgi:hypothetical protein
MYTIRNIIIFLSITLLLGVVVSKLHLLKKNNQIDEYEKLPQLPEEVIKYMSQRGVRQMHYMWHQTRNRWNSLTDAEKEILTKMGWYVPRPSRYRNQSVIYDNDSGEDFLYMHREMINQVNEILANGDYDYGTEIEGWDEIPAPNDTLYPVPQLKNGTIQTVKTDEFYLNILLPISQKFKDPNYLRTITLGELGARLEFDIHNSLHLRWADFNKDFKPIPNPWWDLNAIDKKWDDPSYDHLGDFYSSQIHPLFWKLHGWVDDRIYDWQDANGIEEIIWKGTWVGPMNMDHSMPHSHSHSHSHNHQSHNHQSHNHTMHHQTHQKSINHPSHDHKIRHNFQEEYMDNDNNHQHHSEIKEN